ncbi:MAG: hypothetical protein MUE36_06395 [Acidimicrobiales bacterium]|nr:hypothetical protein [Acidimicrobiales bacterium]
MVLVILAVVWALYLASWLRSRTETRRVDSISSFNRHLSVLERTTPGGMARHDLGAARARVGLAPSTGGDVVRRPVLSPAKKRRKDILTGLMVAVGTTAVAALVMGGVFRLLFVLAAVLLGAYVALLVQTQKRMREQREKVRYLAHAPVPPARAPSWQDRAGEDEAWGDQAWDEVPQDGTYGAGRALPGDAGVRYVAVPH